MCPPVPSFVFAVLFVPSFNVLSGYLYVSLILVVDDTVLDCRSSLSFSYHLVRGSVRERELVVHSDGILSKFRDTAPLKCNRESHHNLSDDTRTLYFNPSILHRR